MRSPGRSPARGDSTGARSKSNSRTHLASPHARLTTAQGCGTLKPWQRVVGGRRWDRTGPRVKNNIMLLFAEVLVIDAMQSRLHGPRCAFPPARRTDAMQQSPGDQRATDGNNKGGRPDESFSDYFSRPSSRASVWPARAIAQSTVYMPAVRRIVGRGRRVRHQLPRRHDAAVEEINAKGGILGRKIDMPVFDTQSDAGVSRAQIQKVLDNKPYVIFGPVYSGSVLVDMELTQAGRDSGNRRRRSRDDHPEGQSLRLPHFVRPAVQHAEDRQLHRATASRPRPSRSCG